MKTLSRGPLKYILIDANNNQLDKYEDKALAQLIQKNHKGSQVMSLNTFQEMRRENMSTTLQEPIICQQCDQVTKKACKTDPEFICPHMENEEYTL